MPGVMLHRSAPGTPTPFMLIEGQRLSALALPELDPDVRQSSVGDMTFMERATRLARASVLAAHPGDQRSSGPDVGP
jgi:hypothetical protein